MRLAVIVPAVLALAASAVALASPHIDDQAEQRILNQINRARIVDGALALVPDMRLRTLARFHSADMALAGFVSTMSPTEGPLLARAAAALGITDGQRVFVNVAAVTDASVLGNLVADPETSRVGVGVVSESNRLFVTVISLGDLQPIYAHVSNHGEYRSVVAMWLARVEHFLAFASGARIAARGALP